MKIPTADSATNQNKNVIFKFLFLASRFISLFNPATHKNPRLEWDTEWAEPAPHVITRLCGALQSSHRELSEPHGCPGTISWDPPNTSAGTVTNLPQEPSQAPAQVRGSLHPVLTSPSWMCLAVTTISFPHSALPGALQILNPAATPDLARVILHIEGPDL